MKFLVQLVMGLCLAGPMLAEEAQVQPTLPPQETLLKATLFGFGVKKGQPPNARPTDTAYHMLMDQKDAKEQFAALFEKGNVYAKCYALCALHKLDKELFTKMSATLDPKTVVRTRDGCCISEPTVKEVIGLIEEGRYAHMNLR